MTRIMFICHGNICRSPMAEIILKELVKRAGRESEFHISSAATSTEEIWNGVGNPVYPPAEAELKKHGFLCNGKRAQQIHKDDYDKYDLFLCMDNNNLKNSIRIFGGDSEEKVKLFLSYTGKNKEVYDPWYSGDFSTAYNDIYTGCMALLEKI